MIEGLSAFLPESDAIKALSTADYDFQKLFGLENQIVIDHVNDDWESKRGGSAHMAGSIVYEGSVQPVKIDIYFAGLFERALAAIKRRDPRASANLTVGL